MRRYFAALLLMLGAVCLLPAFGEESMDDVLIAFDDVAKNGANASPLSKAISFKHNETLQHMRINNQVQNSVFQANQANFSQINDGLIADAATKNGVSYSPQQTAPGKTPTPGTDTDGIIKSAQPGKPMTAQQVANTRGTYDNNVNEFLKKNGVSGGKPPNTNTSIMPDPESMEPSEWKKAIDAADAAGEVVYKDPAAAAAEAKIRAGKPLSMGEANARVSEVNRLANEHFSAADELDAAARKLPPGPKREALTAQAQIARSNGAKYVNRITETGNYMAQQNHLPPAGETGGTMKGASVRSPDTAREAAAAGAMNQHFTSQATQGYIQNMANIANASKDPAVIAQSEKNIAQALNNLPPAQQGNVLDSLAKNNPKLASNVAKTMRTLPKPPIGPPPPSKFQKALKVLGPAMILYEGGSRIWSVGTAKDPSQEAGKQLGGFVGGTAGGAAGGIAGAKAGGWIGAGIGSFFGPPGTAIGGTIGAIVGGIYGGYKGYTYGSGHGTEMGDTNSKYWDKNKSDEEFNKLAMGALAQTPQSVYDTLIGMGISPEKAKAAADAYRNGSLDEFRRLLNSCRTQLANKQKWPPNGYRRFNDLGTNEVPELLHCLCSASLGANPWVAQGYNLNIPKDADPKKHSCGSLNNGPCMAQGFGCWRSFMNLGSQAARDCMESQGIEPNQWNIGKIHEGFQKKYEKPFKLDFIVTPTEVCPGDTVNVQCDVEGGMGGYEFQYEWGHILVPPEGTPPVFTPTSSRSMTFKIPEMRRGFYDGHWVYERGAEAYNSYVRVLATAMTIEGGVPTRVSIHKIMTVTLRPHDQCEKLKPPEKKEPPKKTPPKAPPKTGTRPGVQRPEVSGPDSTGPGPVIPPPGGYDSEDPDEKTETSDEEVGKGTDKGKGKKTKRSGKSGEPEEPDDQIHPDEPDGQKPEDAPDSGGDDYDCFFGGGGTCIDGGPATIFGSVPEGQRIRMTIKGSDGFVQTVEGTTQVEIQRPLNPNGTDTIIMENLDKPECREEQLVPYDEKGAPAGGPPQTTGGIRDAEPVSTGGAVSAGPGILDGYVTDQHGQSDSKTDSAIGIMDANTQLGAASTAGDADAAAAAGIRSAGGADAGAIRDASVKTTTAADAASSWGHVIGGAVIDGVGQGLTTFGSTLGTGLGTQAGNEIFDGGHHHDKTAPPPEEIAETPPDKTQTERPPRDHEEPDDDDNEEPPPAEEVPVEPPVETVSQQCFACGYVMTIPVGQSFPPSCPNCGAGESPTDADGNVTVNCSACGFSMTLVPGQIQPANCPNCGAGY
ncbi:MAG: hypothetical protein AB7T27_01145 [Kiritimatiellia bacterium]